MGGFVSLGLAARWYGGEAGENEPVKRCRFALCSDMKAAASKDNEGGCGRRAGQGRWWMQRAAGRRADRGSRIGRGSERRRSERCACDGGGVCVKIRDWTGVRITGGWCGWVEVAEEEVRRGQEDRAGRGHGEGGRIAQAGLAHHVTPNVGNGIDGESRPHQPTAPPMQPPPTYVQEIRPG